MLRLLHSHLPQIQRTTFTTNKIQSELQILVNSILLGDTNARVGNDFHSWPNCLGKFGVGKLNKNSQPLLELCCRRFSVSQIVFSPEKHIERSHGVTLVLKPGTNLILSS